MITIYSLLPISPSIFPSYLRISPSISRSFSAHSPSIRACPPAPSSPPPAPHRPPPPMPPGTGPRLAPPAEPPPKGRDPRAMSPTRPPRPRLASGGPSCRRAAAKGIGMRPERSPKPFEGVEVGSLRARGQSASSKRCPQSRSGIGKLRANSAMSLLRSAVRSLCSMRPALKLTSFLPV